MARKSKPTRSDVAALAGVSNATVSNVLNRSEKVKDETARRVREAIETLNYSPDLVARSLITGRTMQLGIILEDVLNPFYTEVIREFENAASERGYFVNICSGLHKVDAYFESAVNRGLDGIFVTALPYKFHVEKLSRLVERDVKVLTTGNVSADYRLVSSIEQDYASAMAAAMDHLYSLGHRHIAYLSGLGPSQTFDLRYSSYQKCVKNLGLPDGDSLLISGGPPYTTNIRDGYVCANRLLKSGRPFSAAVCGNDLMAFGAIRAFREHGLRIPEDVSVMGFDGIQMGEYWDPPLTTMSLDKKEFGYKAFALLYNNIVNDNTGYSMIKLNFHKGGSTGPCPEHLRT